MIFRQSTVPHSLLATLLLPFLASATIFPVQIKQITTRSPDLHGRADISGQPIGTKHSVPLRNSHNTQYISNITIGGRDVPVLLDTGSSDLWVTGNVPGAKDSGKSTTLSYAIGQATGNINYAPLGFDNYTVNDQAFLLVTDTSKFSSSFNELDFKGLVGLGPNSGSVIRKTMNKDPAADSVLSRIFQQNHTTQNFISFLLDRQKDPTNHYAGQITISEFIPGLENITSQPKLTVEKVYKLTSENQHWQILADKDQGVIGPDGNVIKVKSGVPKAPSGHLVAVIDSGFSFPQVPRAVSDMIYGRVQGASYDADSEIWTVPCDQYLSISFNFGGVNFPIHPLDTVTDDFDVKDINGNPVCLGTFQPITSAFSLLGEYDLILGMSFLRNSYTLLDYGNFVSATSNDQGDPYVQLLPLTNADSAKADFIQVRLKGTDTTNSPSKALLPISQMQHSPESAKEKHDHYKAYVLSRWPYIFVGCLVFLGLVTGLCVWKFCCRRRRSEKKGLNEDEIKSGDKPSYMPLQMSGRGSSGRHGGSYAPV